MDTCWKNTRIVENDAHEDRKLRLSGTSRSSDLNALSLLISRFSANLPCLLSTFFPPFLLSRPIKTTENGNIVRIWKMHSSRCSRWRHHRWEGAKLSRLRFQRSSRAPLPRNETAGKWAEDGNRLGERKRAGLPGGWTETVPRGTTRLVLPHNNI